MATERLIVGLAGMPGAGKSLVVDVAKESGYSIVAMGDVVREETHRRGLELTSDNVGKVMLDLRKEEGENAVAKRTLVKIREIRGGKILVDGVRSLSEVAEFGKYFRKLSLLSIHASPDTRFKRLYMRGRSDDSSNWEVFVQRDMRELAVGLGSAIAMSEDIIVNEEEPEIAKRKICETLRKIEKKWMK